MSTGPSAKTGHTVLGGAVVSILVWILTTTVGVEVPAEVAAAAATLVAGAIALLVPATSGKYIDLEADRQDWDYERDGRMVDYATVLDEPAALTEEDGA